MKPEANINNPLVERTLQVTNLDTTDAGWGQTIQVPTHGDKTSKPKLSVRFTLPSDEALAGRAVRVRVAGTIAYPVVSFGLAIGGGSQPGTVFTETSTSINESRFIQILSREENATARQAAARYEEAKKRYEKEQQAFDQARIARSRAKESRRDEAEKRAAGLLPFVWLCVPLWLLAVPLACRLGRKPLPVVPEVISEADRVWRS